MNRTAAITAIAIAAFASPAVLAAQTPGSAAVVPATGLYLGSHVSAGSFTASADRTRTYGSGAGVSIGYLFTPSLGVELTGSGAFFDDTANESFLLGHTDLLVHYRFAAPDRRWTPSLHAGATWRSSRAVELTDEQISISRGQANGAVSFGAGLGYAAAPGITLQGQLTRSAGNVAGDECPVSGAQKSCAVSNRLTLGLRWHPRLR